MRRSTMWFLIAGFWMINAAIMLYRNRIGEAGLVLGIVLVFAMVEFGFSRAEIRRSRRNGRSWIAYFFEWETGLGTGLVWANAWSSVV